MVDEAKKESDPGKPISDYLSSDAEDVDIYNNTLFPRIQL